MDGLSGGAIYAASLLWLVLGWFGRTVYDRVRSRCEHGVLDSQWCPICDGSDPESQEDEQ